MALLGHRLASALLLVVYLSSLQMNYKELSTIISGALLAHYAHACAHLSMLSQQEVFTTLCAGLFDLAAVEAFVAL